MIDFIEIGPAFAQRPRATPRQDWHPTQVRECMWTLQPHPALSFLHIISLYSLFNFSLVDQLCPAFSFSLYFLSNRLPEGLRLGTLTVSAFPVPRLFSRVDVFLHLFLFSSPFSWSCLTSHFHLYCPHLLFISPFYFFCYSMITKFPLCIAFPSLPLVTNIIVYTVLSFSCIPPPPKLLNLSSKLFRIDYY